MGCGGALTSEEPLNTCQSWLEFLTGAGSSMRKVQYERRRRLPLIWDHLARAGVKVGAMDVPVPVESQLPDGCLTPRPCPVLVRPDFTRPEDVLMNAEDRLREAVSTCRTEDCDLFLFGLPVVDLIARGPRSEAETFLVAHKSIDSIVRRLINELEPDYTVVFSPFSVARGTKSQPGRPDGEEGLWIVNGPDVPAGVKAEARLVDLLPTLIGLMDVKPSGKLYIEGESLCRTVRCEPGRLTELSKA